LSLTVLPSLAGTTLAVTERVARVISCVAHATLLLCKCCRRRERGHVVSIDVYSTCFTPGALPSIVYRRAKERRAALAGINRRFGAYFWLTVLAMADSVRDQQPCRLVSGCSCCCLYPTN